MDNSMIESFWSYFNICVRDLSDDECQHINDPIQPIAWAWNTIVKSSTSVRPFEAMTGTTPVTITDSLVLPAPTNTTLNMSNIHDAAAAYALIAREHGNYMRKQRAEGA